MTKDVIVSISGLQMPAEGEAEPVEVMEMEWLCDTVCEMDAGQLEVVYEK